MHCTAPDLTPRHRWALLSVAIAAFALSSATASAHPREPFTATGAMRAGIYEYADFPARHVARGVVHAFAIHVACRPIPIVGQRRPCTGTFRLRRGDRVARYRLTARASTFRNTEHSIEYAVWAHTDHPLPGLPATTGGFAGFIEDHSGKP